MICNIVSYFILSTFFFACGTKEVKRPNILFAISDDQSYPHAGAYGYTAAQTPSFDRIASEGILFNNAFTAAPGCSPSRASILTGRHIWQIEDAGTHASEFPTKYVCYTDLLDSAGYHVGYTAKGWGPGNWKISGRTRNPVGKEYSEIIDESVPQYIRNTDYAANFKAFLNDRKPGQPFCFWYGASEPHRRYKDGIGVENGFQLSEIKVPPFLPDVDDVKSDIADYLYEINHFDVHLGRMIQMLEEIGELDNTIIVVTSDNGMPFPRAKANVYEYGIHMPMAVRWGEKVNSGRVVDDLVSLTDLAPTFLELAGVQHPSEVTGEYPMIGVSLKNILLTGGSGIIDPKREAVYSGRERHSSSRWNNLTYPQRAVRTHQYLYIKNFKPERWPAGAPEKLTEEGELAPGYHDIDNFTESYIYINRDLPEVKKYFDWAVAKRPLEELYDIKSDPSCLKNLALDPEFEKVLIDHRNRLQSRLEQTKDPRVMGNGDIWEDYVRYSPIRQFPEPDWKTN
jgi:N-sulfoglucosamine sulfohydrolase